MNEKAVYFCDRKACGDVCPNPENCSRTFNIRHAVNFKADRYGDTVYYVEKEYKSMTINEYQRLALRTDPLNSPYFAFGGDLSDFKKKLDLNHIRLLEGLLGLSGEGGEAADLMKKFLFQGHPFDREHMAKELGDIAWYLAISADALGYDLETIFQMNIDKLRARYPEGFEVEKSLHRKEGDI